MHLDYSDYTTKRLQTMLQQGKYYNIEQIDAVITELQRRGLLSDFQKVTELERIDKERFQHDLQLQEDYLHQHVDKGSALYWFEWKYLPHTINVISLLVSIYLFIQFGIIAWYILIGGMATSQGSKLFRRRFDR